MVKWVLELAFLVLSSWIASTSNTAVLFEKNRNLNTVILVHTSKDYSKDNRNILAYCGQGLWSVAASSVFSRKQPIPVSKYTRFNPVKDFYGNSKSKTCFSKIAVNSGLNSDQPNWQRKKHNFHLENARIKSVTRKLARVESPSISIELMVEDLSLEVCAQVRQQTNEKLP
jgi:hypothetical protein